jgi:hypothetical protein
MRRNEIIGLCVAVFALVIALIVLTLSRSINIAQGIEILITFVLVLVTVGYVRRTAEIAGATREQAEATRRQADASVRMAKETREKRYSESLPLLVPTIPPILNTDKLPYESLQSGVGMKVLWRNLGKGVAIHSRVSFETLPTSTGKATFFSPRNLGTVEVGGKKEVDYSEILDDGQLHNISDAYQPYRPRVEVEYLDIYERKVTTVQEFCIDEQNRKPFLGELYFKINDRRLGEEVIHHD